jgi:quercetin dioxygenase-like cupin family protein
MQRRVLGVSSIGVLVIGMLLGVAAAQEKNDAVHVDSAKATYKELAPGAMVSVLSGDLDKGPYAAFTKFAPGAKFPLHTHTSDIRIVVLKGAYMYKPENGEEMRVGAGQSIFIPGGNRHSSGGDAKAGAVFYQESTGKFDLNFVK